MNNDKKTNAEIALIHFRSQGWAVAREYKDDISKILEQDEIIDRKDFFTVKLCLMIIQAELMTREAGVV